MTPMDLKINLSLIFTVLAFVFGAIWKLSASLSKMDERLDGHISHTAEWRQTILDLIKELRDKKG